MSGNDRGYSLIELMIVIAILGLLLAILQDSYSRWSRRYRVESEAKSLHSYILDARARAITRYRAHFVITSGAGYSVVEDTTPWPDGNGAYDTGAGGDNLVHTGLVAAPFTIETAVSGVDAANPLTFGRDGTASGTGYIRIVPGIGSVDYDCVDVAPTRIRVGRFDGTVCQPR